MKDRLITLKVQIEDDQLFSFKEATDFLGISTLVLIRLLAEEEIPARKMGRKWRFSKAALIRWVAEGNSKKYSDSKFAEEEEIDMD